LEATDGVCYSDEYKTDEYRHGGYATYGGGLIGKAKGVTNVTLNFDTNEKCKVTTGHLPSNFNYDEEITVSNFTMLLTGYLYAEETGYYTIAAYGDSVFVNFPSGTPVDCCGNPKPEPNPEIGVFGTGGERGSNGPFYSPNLEGGFYYPITILYTNKNFDDFKFFVGKNPDVGGLVRLLPSAIFQLPDGKDSCPNEVSFDETSWTGTFRRTYSTTSFTSIGSDGYGTIETTYYIQTPSASSSAPSASS
ncbi:hypothetical protein C6P45_003806, partial [Maudiozyma exigua]